MTIAEASACASAELAASSACSQHAVGGSCEGGFEATPLLGRPLPLQGFHFILFSSL